MGKMSMGWHRKCLSNTLDCITRDRADLERRIAEQERREREFKFYSDQVAEAERRGMDAFDRDRLLVKRTGS